MQNCLPACRSTGNRPARRPAHARADRRPHPPGLRRRPRAEFELRLQGASYEQIARAGGGIRSTVAATRAASDAAVPQRRRAPARLMAEGVTTLEIKSGYGLSQQHEAAAWRGAPPGPRTATDRAHHLAGGTCAAAGIRRPRRRLHRRRLRLAARPAAGRPGRRGRRLLRAHRLHPAQTRRVFDAARALGLPVKLHAEQLSDQGGAALAAGYGALSCDHLEHLSARRHRRDAAAAGTVAVLLPGAFYFLRETKRCRRCRRCATPACRWPSPPTTTRAPRPA
jgi:imidazolonepropionase